MEYGINIRATYNEKTRIFFFGHAHPVGKCGISGISDDESPWHGENSPWDCR